MYCSTREIKLTPKEYDLLHYLMGQAIIVMQKYNWLYGFYQHT